MQNENQDSSNLFLKNWNSGVLHKTKKLKNQTTLGQTSNSSNFKLGKDLFYFALRSVNDK